MKLSCLDKEAKPANDFEGGVGFQVGPELKETTFYLLLLKI